MLLPTLKNLLKLTVSTVSKLTDSAGKLVAPLSPSPGFKALAGTVMLAIVLFWLFGCSTQSRTVRPTMPPQANARAVPDFNGRTHRDILLHAIEVKEGWLSCEQDKVAIRRLYEPSK